MSQMDGTGQAAAREHSTGELVKQVAERNSERGCQRPQRAKRGIAVTEFEFVQGGLSEAGRGRQFRQRHARGAAVPAQVAPDGI